MQMNLRLLAAGASVLSLSVIAPTAATVQAPSATSAVKQITPLRLGQRQEVAIAPGVTYSYLVEIARADQYVAVSVRSSGAAISSVFPTIKFFDPDGKEVPAMLFGPHAIVAEQPGLYRVEITGNIRLGAPSTTTQWM